MKASFNGIIEMSYVVVKANVELGGLSISGHGPTAVEATSINIQGDLLCSEEAKFQGELNFQTSRIGGDFFLRGEIEVTRGRAITLNGAKIEGRVSFLADSTLKGGGISAIGVSVSGSFDLSNINIKNCNDMALVLQRAEIGGALMMCNKCRIAGNVYLAYAKIGILNDSAECRPSEGYIELEGCEYTRFGGHAPVDAKSRLEWLERQPKRDLGKEFRPQPWEQLARVLAATGHEADARVIRIEKRRRMRWLDYERAPKGFGKFKAGIGAIADKALDLLAGYGYRPWRTVFALLLLWFVGGLVFSYADREGIMAPTDSKVFLDPTIPAECREHWTAYTKRVPRPSKRAIEDLVEAREKAGLLPDSAPWEKICPRLLPAEYSTFTGWIYSLDVVLPLVDLRQERDWAPRVTDGNGDPLFAGHVVRAWEWFQILAGWGLSLLLVAALSGIVKKE